MTPALFDLTRALDHAISREADAFPAAYRAQGDALAALVKADVRERLLVAEDDAERERLCKRWLRS